jgi:hypothetical protein
MVRIISALNSHPFLTIWYAILQIRRIWKRIWILFIRISDGYGSGYGIVIIRRIRINRHFSWIIRPFLFRIIRFSYLQISPSIILVPKWPSLYIDYYPTYYIIIACLYVYSSLLVPTYLAVAYFYFFTKNRNIKFT